MDARRAPILASFALVACGAPFAAGPPSVGGLAELAEGSRAWIDPTRGLAVVIYATDASGEAPEADADGMIRIARRACGEALECEITRLRQGLSARLDDPQFVASLACDETSCTIPARAEFDLSAELKFVEVDGRSVLDTVVWIEGGPVTEDFRAAGRAFADEQLAQLAGGRCP